MPSQEPPATILVPTIGDKQQELERLVREFLTWDPENQKHAGTMATFLGWAKTRLCATLGPLP